MIFVLSFGFLYFQIQVTDKYNTATADFIAGNKLKVESDLIEIINKKDTAYSPLALYFLVDNKIINKRNKVNELFDIVINETSLEKEIKNLIIYKKALYNADFFKENELLGTLKPVLNSESVCSALLAVL